MTVVLRYAGFAVLLLFAVALAMVCGELMCESCAHACCGRVDRAERARRAVSRLLPVVPDGIRGIVSEVGVAHGARWFESALSLAIPLALGSLRI